VAITAKQEGIFVCAYDGDRKLWQKDGTLVACEDNKVFVQNGANRYVYDENGEKVSWNEPQFTIHVPLH